MSPMLASTCARSPVPVAGGASPRKTWSSSCGRRRRLRLVPASAKPQADAPPPRDAPAHDQHPPAHRRAPGGRAAHGRHPDHVQRSRPVRRAWPCGPIQGGLPEEARRRPGLHVASSSRRASRRCGPSRRSTPASTAPTSSITITTTSAWPSAPRSGLMVPVLRDADRTELRPDREGASPSWPTRPATARSAWTTCKAAPSPSPTAASSARCCRRRSSTRRRAASWACTPSRSGRWRSTTRS